jgi:hypothetical protein
MDVVLGPIISAYFSIPLEIYSFENLINIFLSFYFLCHFRFINARRRIVQPMIDQSNRAGI